MSVVYLITFRSMVWPSGLLPTATFQALNERQTSGYVPALRSPSGTLAVTHIYWGRTFAAAAADCQSLASEYGRSMAGTEHGPLSHSQLIRNTRGAGNTTDPLLVLRGLPAASLVHW